VYWKCPVAQRPGVAAPTGFVGRVEARFSATQDDADQPTWLVRDDRGTSDDYNTRRLRLSYSAQSGDELLCWGQVRRDWGADEFEIHELYLTHSGWDWAHVSFGQMMTPFDREFLTSDPKLPLAERPLAGTVLVPDRDIGLLLHDAKCTESFGWYAGIFTGNGKNELSADGTLMPAARVEWLATPELNLAASWARNNNGRASNFQKFLKKNGDAYGLQELYAAERLDEEAWGLDLLFRRDATAVWAGYTNKKVSGPTGLEADGWYVHLAHYVPHRGERDKLELVAGYEGLDPNKSVSDQLDARWLTVGLNYHIEGARRQVRVQYVARDEKSDEVDNNTFLVEYDHVFP
jgi:hypothetical protein